MLIVVLCLTTACAESIGSIEPPKVAQPDDELTERCEDPVVVNVPENGKRITQFKVEQYWLKDRRNLAKCRDQLDELVEWYTNRDNAIQGITL